MADANVVPAAAENAAVDNAEGQQQQQRPNAWSMIKTLLIRMVFIYFIANMFKRGSTPAPDASGSKSGSVARPSSNVFEKFAPLDMYVYVSEQEEFSDFKNEASLFWMESGLVYGDWVSGPNEDGTFTKSGQIEASEAVQNNGSLFIHVYFVREGKSPDPADRASKMYSKKFTVHRSKRINKFKKRKYHQSVNLLTGQTEAHPDLVQRDNISFEILSHWHPNLTINLLDDNSPWVPGAVPQPLDEYIEFLPGQNKYYPVIYLNDYWNLNADYMPINDTTKILNFTLTYSPMSLFKWQLYAAQGMRNKWVNMLGSEGGEDEEDQDSLKTAFLETSPYLLGLTIVVSILHSVFEFLAFKNDIQFWKSRKSLEGLSVRSVFFNVIQSLIVLLYICDNETNTVVKISVFVGLCIEIWKINKVVNAKLDYENKLFGIIPRPRLTEKSTYTQSHTKEYDILAFKYLSWLLYPLLGVYAVYSLLYLEHKGWYSWVLSMLYGFLLTFGFIMMTPQLFINYKLKSVAHLPWRMLTYKALNTFIDDIFAFVIKMPTLYRLGCLRDDVIFFIYLYQRYIYSVDPKRMNEFGTSQEMLESNGEVTPAEERAQLQEGQSSQAAEAVTTEDSDSGTKEPEETEQENGEVKTEEEKKNE
ncbi:hypothetical protein EGW08_020322 [Elysia chlorotica]|uniref:Cleft lip and palate transmembrane protein 1 n=1 Tax=Elysia chlorotica TaxID=188477 RepID=A0A3S1H496_ELYCH|nr:hypothetical protein EGW08_020322 [Elysia chlorotica]